MPICSAGHDSQAPDYCDVCGARLAVGAVAHCPRCDEPRVEHGRFCENCRYDFGAQGSVQGPCRSRMTSEAPLEPPSPGPAPAGIWTAVVSADRAHYDSVVSRDGPDAGEILFPPYCPERRVVLAGAQVRIGRHSASRGITPEIDLTGPPEDPGVSHLHAVLLPAPDGSWTIVDPGSTNGTHLNDDPEPIATNSPVPLHDGDRIHIGAWTTITLRRQ
ncbi:MAG: FHA domain-containing protein [Egibacteraceae bacterium]